MTAVNQRIIFSFFICYSKKKSFINWQNLYRTLRSLPFLELGDSQGWATEVTTGEPLETDYKDRDNFQSDSDTLHLYARKII